PLLRSKPDTVIYERASIAGCANWYIALRQDRPPFNDVRLRRALSLAIDRQAIGQAVYEGKAESRAPPPWREIFDSPPADLGPYYRYDPAEARRLLAETGNANGLEIEFAYSPYTPNVETTVLLLQQQLKPAGISLKLQSLPYNTYSEQYFGGKCEAAIWGGVNIFPPDATALAAATLLP